MDSTERFIKRAANMDTSSEISERSYNKGQENQATRLRRKYEMLVNEKERMAGTVECLHAIDQNEINRLLAYQQNILKELELASSSANYTRDKSNREKLEHLLIQKEEIMSNTSAKKQSLDSLNRNIKEWEEKVHNMRIESSKVKYSNLDKYCASVLEKRERVLESRLHGINKNFNNTLARNAKIKDTISTQQNEKHKFQNKYDRLSTRHVQNQFEISQILDKGLSIHDQIEDMRTKTELMFEKDERDKQQFEFEFRNESLVMSNARKLKNFMVSKDNSREDQLDEKFERLITKFEEADREREDRLKRLEKAWDRIVSLILSSDHHKQNRHAVTRLICQKFRMYNEEHMSSYHENNFVEDAIAEVLRRIDETDFDRKNDLKRQNSHDSSKNVKFIEAAGMESRKMSTVTEVVTLKNNELRVVQENIKLADESNADISKEMLEDETIMKNVLSKIGGMIEHAGTHELDGSMIDQENLKMADVEKIVGEIEDRYNLYINYNYQSMPGGVKFWKQYIDMNNSEAQHQHEMHKTRPIEIPIPSKIDFITGQKTETGFNPLDVDLVLDDYEVSGLLKPGAELNKLVRVHMGIKEKQILDQKKRRRSTIFGKRNGSIAAYRRSTIKSDEANAESLRIQLIQKKLVHDQNMQDK